MFKKEKYMNYRKVYMKIISNSIKETKKGLRPWCKSQKKKFSEYYEFHHILPKSLFPLWAKKSSNIVALTAREHFFCHQLLTKIYPGKKMFFALWRLCHSSPYCLKSSRQYNIIQKQHSELQKEIWQNKTDEEKEVFIKNRKVAQQQVWDSRDATYRKEFGKKVKEVWAKRTPEDRKLSMKKAWSNRDNSNFKKKTQQTWLKKTPEQRAEIAKRMVESSKNNPKYKEILEKRRRSVVATNGKKVICLETGEIFETITAAREIYGNMRYCLKNGSTKHYKGQELHFKYLSEIGK